jgi:hypothetical protein
VARGYHSKSLGAANRLDAKTRQEHRHSRHLRAKAMQSLTLLTARFGAATCTVGALASRRGSSSFGKPEQEEEEERGAYEAGGGGGDGGASIAELQHTCRTMLASQSLLLDRMGSVTSELISHRAWGYDSASDLSASLAVATRLDSMLEDLVTDATCAADAIHAALVPHTPQAYAHDTVATNGYGSADTVATKIPSNGSTNSGVVRPRERLESEIELLRGRLQSGVIRLTLSLQRMHAGEGDQSVRLRKDMQEDLRYVEEKFSMISTRAYAYTHLHTTHRYIHICRHTHTHTHTHTPTYTHTHTHTHKYTHTPRTHTPYPYS